LRRQSFVLRYRSTSKGDIPSELNAYWTIADFDWTSHGAFFLVPSGLGTGKTGEK
jgi:hypothetical protein